MLQNRFHRLIDTSIFGSAKSLLSWNLKQSFPVRSLTGVIRPMDIDDTELNSPSAVECRQAYEQILTRYKTLVHKSYDGGGDKGRERHVQKNKKVVVRDRIKMLIDPGTEFFELGTLAGFELPYGDVPNGGMVSGIGRVAGIYCLIGGNDATVKAGTYFPISVQKSLRMQEISEVNRLPSVYIPDSGGAFLPLQSLIFLDGGRSFYNQAVMSSKGIPQIAVVGGSCTAGGAYNPTMSDEAVIIDGIGKIFLGGPPLVRAAVQEIVTEEELGGAFLHSSVSGCTDYFARTEEEAFEICRDVVEGLNFNIPSTPSYEPANYAPVWDYIGSRQHLNKSELYTVLAGLLDQSRFKEFKAFYGPGLITGIGYIEGSIVGIIGNSDAILSDEALKGAHFLDLCERRGIPILFLQNSSPPGQTDSSHDVTVVKCRGRLSSAVATVDVPKIAVTLTRCDRDDLLLLCGPSFSPNFSYMWPNASLSVSDMEIRDENSEDSDPGTLNAFDAAANMVVDNVILPENSRTVIGQTLRIFSQMKLNPWVQPSKRPIFRM